VEKYGRARQATDVNIIRRMRFACWITKATDTHSEYVILIAFPRQQWLRERASLLRSYVDCLCCLTENECVYCAVRTVFMCFVWISEQTAIISLYNIN
jgi:hypothetical protein